LNRAARSYRDADGRPTTVPQQEGGLGFRCQVI
jgi:hypothetical protein